MAVPLVCKRGHCIVIMLVIDLTPPNEKLNGNNSMRQGTFENVSWETWRLQTEKEKKSEWSKDTEKDARGERSSSDSGSCRSDG